MVETIYQELFLNIQELVVITVFVFTAVIIFYIFIFFTLTKTHLVFAL